MEVVSCRFHRLGYGQYASAIVSIVQFTILISMLTSISQILAYLVASESAQQSQRIFMCFTAFILCNNFESRVKTRLVNIKGLTYQKKTAGFTC
jgi:hypothetical protein